MNIIFARNVLSTIVLFYLLSLGAGLQTFHEAKAEPFTENHALFRDAGIVLSQTTFYHIRFEVDVGSILSQIENATAEVNRMQRESDEAFRRDGRYQLALLEARESNMSGLTDESAYYMSVATNNDYVLRSASQLINRTSKRLLGTVESLPPLGNMAGKNLHHQRFRKSPGAEHLIHHLDQGSLVESESGDARFGHLHLKRERREVAGVLGIVIGSVALGLAVRNSIKVDYLEEKVKDVVSSTNKIVDSFQLMQDDGKLLRLDLESLKVMTYSMATKSVNKLTMATYNMNEGLNDFYHQLDAAVTSAQHQRLAPGLISGDNLQLLFDKVKGFAEANDQTMFLQHPSDLYQIDTSFGYSKESKKLLFYVHVPMSKRGQYLTLREYIPFPVLQSLTLNSTILPVVGEGRYIATLPQIQGDKSDQEQFRIMTDSELLKCRKLGDYHLCGGRNTLRKDIFNTCIGSMLRKSSEAITKSCDFEYQPFREYVARLSPNEWLVMTKEQLSLNVNCFVGQTPISHKISLFGQTKLSLPENCHVFLSDHVLSTDWNLEEDYEINISTWPGPAFEGVNFNDDLLRKAYLNLINSTLSFKKSDLSFLKIEKMMESDNLKTVRDWFSNLSPVSAISDLLSKAAGVNSIVFAVFCLISTISSILVLKYCGCCQFVGTMAKATGGTISNLAGSIKGSMADLSQAIEKKIDSTKPVPRFFKKPDLSFLKKDRKPPLASAPILPTTIEENQPASDDSSVASSQPKPSLLPYFPQQDFYGQSVKTIQEDEDVKTTSFTLPETERAYPFLPPAIHSEPVFRPATPHRGLTYGPDEIYEDEEELSYRATAKPSLLQRTKSCLSLASNFHESTPSSPSSPQTARAGIVNHSDCNIRNITTKGKKLTDFHCTLHDPVGGCSGIFIK